MHLIFAGNPGAGKSTLANTVLGEPIFRSGVALGQGLTQVLDSHVMGDIKVSDTPGFDDINLRDRAASEISSGLSQGGQLRLIFVVTLEEGRVRRSDVATIATILDALENVHVDVNNKFSLIVNKCHDRELQLLQQEEYANIVRQAFGGHRQVGHMVCLPKDESAVGSDDTLLTEGVDALLSSVFDAPVMVVPDVAVNVEADSFDARLEELRGEIGRVRERLEELQRAEEEQQNEGIMGRMMKEMLYGMAGQVVRLGIKRYIL